MPSPEPCLCCGEVECHCTEIEFEACIKRQTEWITYLERALKEISKGEGTYSRDRLQHATNTIMEMKEIASGALGGKWEVPDESD
jgi:hypothetical protein